METVLITGGAGAIGSNLAGSLIERGYRTVILDDLTSGHLSLVPKEAQLIQGSVNNAAKLAEAFSHRPSLVVHMAALFANQNSVDHPELDLQVNGLGTLQVLLKAQEQRVKKLVYVSSSCVYGKQTELVESNSALHPETPYGITKLLGEYYCRYFADYHQLQIAMVRPFNSYGPGEFPGKYRNVIPNFIWRAMHQLPLQITGDGSETRDFTYVSDTVQGIMTALLTETSPADVFNIASGRATPILELAQKINVLTGNAQPVQFLPRRGWDGIRHRQGDITHASSKLSYLPRVSLDEGLKQTYLWIQANAEKTPPPVL